MRQLQTSSHRRLHIQHFLRFDYALYSSAATYQLEATNQKVADHSFIVMRVIWELIVRYLG